MMRPASSYRAGRRKQAKALGVSLPSFNKAFDLIARQVEGQIPSPNPEAGAAARKTLGLWAANGGRTVEEVPASSSANMQPIGEKEHIAAAKKITAEDVDKALEAALSRWQDERRPGLLPLSKLFAARARALGWVEGVEFAEE